MTMSPSKIICVGRNYAEHAKELGNAIPDRPVLFMKPPSSLATLAQGIAWNQVLGECHFECEICIQIAEPISQQTDPAKAVQAIGAITLGLDLTLRDVQNELKSKGQPWERAKAFDGSCVLGNWIAIEKIGELNALEFRLSVNGVERQHGVSTDMIFDIATLLVDINQSFSLQVGDVIMTGTPAGVGALYAHDQLSMTLITSKGDHVWTTFCR